jgi:hypothetical protein
MMPGFLTYKETLERGQKDNINIFKVFSIYEEDTLLH